MFTRSTAKQFLGSRNPPFLLTSSDADGLRLSIFLGYYPKIYSNFYHKKEHMRLREP